MASVSRRAFLTQSTLCGVALATSSSRAMGANNRIRLGMIGLGWRASQLWPEFAKLPDVEVTSLCDPDQERVAQAAQQFPRATRQSDMRRVFDDPNVDAVVIATPNHWHALATIWACQAGKHVYVEKPTSHDPWEGRQMLAAQKKYGRIIQVGTNQRSDPMQEEIKKFLHEEQALGKIQHVVACRFGVREPIGLRTVPLAPPPSVAYDLWLGPARDEPIFRNQLHYDWHWSWNTGNGELANWGVHILDDIANVVFRDRVGLPRRVLGAGGRVAWNDAGETPNVGFTLFDAGTIPVLFAVSNLPSAPGNSTSLKYRSVESGYLVQCEGGAYHGQRGAGVAIDNRGDAIRSFEGDSGAGHQKNFIDAVRATDPTAIKSSLDSGDCSSNWCHFANIANRVGNDFLPEAAAHAADSFPEGRAILKLIEGQLATIGVDSGDATMKISPFIEYDAAQHQFIGDKSEEANGLLRREYRAPFEVNAAV